MPIPFRFRWVPFIATMIMVAIGIALGQWQVRRAVEKQAIETKLATRELIGSIVLDERMYSIDEIEYRHVHVRGEFIRTWPVYLDNRPYKGAAGLYVLMPMKIVGSNKYVLIARGWIARNKTDRTALPEIATSNGVIEIDGIVRRNPGHLLQLGQAAELKGGAIVQNLEIDAFEKKSGFSMQPMLIEQLSDTKDGLVRDWPRPSSGVDKHLGYAFQWYGLAAMAFIFFVVTGFRRGTK
jgi:surfeit locus 1 family protein